MKVDETSRSYDIVLFGATGFTGALVAEHLAAHGGETLRWALAGRSRAKLEAIRQRLAQIRPSLAELPIEVADAGDADALAALAAKTRVICTTVGPYAKYGTEVVRACADSGTSYCDITGEIPFVRASIDENHERAIASRARIVHCCGFDSIPSDLGVLMAWDHAVRSGAAGLTQAKVFFATMKGGMSGGTMASALELVTQASANRDVRRLMADPHALDPKRGQPRDPFEIDQQRPHFDADVDRWTAPFPMTINSRIVRRSDALLEYGPAFRYQESLSLSSGPKGLAIASAVTAGLAIGFGAMAFAPTRSFLARRVVPKPGEGPSPEARANGRFVVHVVAKTTEGRTLRGRIECARDPGYAGTAIMLGESALCLCGKDELPNRYGVLTPASAMGMVLVERLKRAGLTFATMEGRS